MRSHGALRSAVQPRVRGERYVGTPDGGVPVGSAPRARGTEAPASDSVFCTRFSPACAGNGCASRTDVRCSTVQPRVRGERGHSVETEYDFIGSAPRARGTGPGPCRPPRDRRFSPACAGNGRNAHPRSLHLTGSAPRARGTASGSASVPADLRFSPACAGNGSRFLMGTLLFAVQPRVRGERMPARCFSVRTSGSAPRARGTVLRDWLGYGR